jgi:hypothetical protein
MECKVKSVAMKVTKEQFENDLRPSLIQMGKHDSTWGGWGDHPYVTVNDKNKKINNYAVVEYNDYYIDHYNPELFLALAAMTDNENGNVGEYWKFIDTVYVGNNFTRGKIYKQHESTINTCGAFIDNNGDCNGLSTSRGGNKSCFVKATKEEIIAYFSKIVDNNKVCFKGDGTDETGIKIINELIRLGGKNIGKYDGNSNSYYYINDVGSVDIEFNIPKGYTLTELPSEMKLNVNNKVCFKSDGTNEIGDKIINELERLGGKNVSGYSGNSNNRYYCINDKGNVNMEYDIPEGYTLTELPSEMKLNVGDLIKVKPDARYRTAIECCWRHGETISDLRMRENQYIFKIEGDLVYVDYEDYKGTNYIVLEKENVELIESKIKEIKMKNRILTPQNATRIINIACSKWKPKLAEKWATNIVLNEDTEISEEFYQEMRKACTTSQNTLFDEIFGSDGQLTSAWDLAIGEALLVTRGNGICHNIVVLRTFDGFVDINNPTDTWGTRGLTGVYGKKVKLTITHEEIK